ncbi:AAA family ATPase [Listeria seeligeri]|uniref:AAA family ATPase n=1 Tax=Listeria seeligeri TaxID=1640 RepID=UPI0010D6B6F5|nr:AAA family ATPase [Listeria seeligeri]EAC8986566.1 DNA helicase [Listeria monocytogenes]EAC9001924.1 DNA helicase [Listeria monocytogenes]EEO3664237.1 AAA family ATPase [Listeria monocytogenes]EIA6531417.1 AAA family ATPase [Listeria monocytogenes]MBC1744543.1 AAA family ATPase [Listeria seeligeri]
MANKQFAQLLLNKVVNDADISQLTKYNIQASDMPTKADRQTFDFIHDYYEKEGVVPSYAALSAQIENFEYVPEITDTYAYLARQVKDYSGKVAVFKLLEDPSMQQKFDGMESAEFIAYMQKALHEIEVQTKVARGLGTDLTQDSEKFLNEYEKRKAGESNKIWHSKFPTVEQELGGYTEGNTYAWYGRSGRGKSIITMEEALQAAVDGANVLIWALEMPWFEWMARAYSSLSARRKIFKAEIDGTRYETGFFNRNLQQGDLPAEFEEAFRVFTLELAEGQHIKGTITLRSVDDDDFDSRNLDALQADIEATKADVVVIDPIYYMDFEQNTSKTAGGDVAATSKKLRRLAGKMKCVIHVVTQAEEEKEKFDEGIRTISIPSRESVKKSKAILEDAAALLAFDSVDNTGVIEIKKGRSGGEGKQAELVFMPSFGVVEELDYSATLVRGF